MSVFSKYNIPINSGTWSGIVLSNSTWKSLADSTYDSTWVYSHNLGIDVSRIKFASISINGGSIWLRHYANDEGYYRYFPKYTITANPFSGQERIFTDVNGNNVCRYYDGSYVFESESNDNNYLRADIIYDQSSGESSSSKTASCLITVTSTQIKINFIKSEGGINFPVSIRTTDPTFDVVIVYE